MARVIVLLLLVALAGCGDDDGPAEGGPLSGPVTVSRAGGVAGISTELVVRPDGTATFTPRRGAAAEPVEVAPEELAALEDALAGWQDVDPDQGPPDNIADAITTTIDYDGHTVTAGDGTDPDDDLERVLGAVGAIAP